MRLQESLHIVPPVPLQLHPSEAPAKARLMQVLLLLCVYSLETAGLLCTFPKRNSSDRATLSSLHLRLSQADSLTVSGLELNFNMNGGRRTQA